MQSRFGSGPRRVLASASAAGLCFVVATEAPAGAANPSPSSSSSSGSGSGEPTLSGQCITQRQPLAKVSNGVSHAQAQLAFTDLWDLSKGDGVNVGIVDSGVNTGPSFGSRLVGGGDLVTPSHDTKGLLDCDGHGTLVAGIVGASPDHETGFSGVAPDSRLISIRQSSALYHNNNGDVSGDDNSLAKAIGMAVQQKAGVINVSTDSCNPASHADSPALSRAVQDAYAKNVVVVVAAGNVGSESCKNQNKVGAAPVTRAQPADLPQALTVAALSKTAQASSFSLAGPWVKIAAPGEGIISTNPQWGHGGEVSTILTDQGPTPIAGTSFAAPYVTGIVALVRARFPKLSAQQVMHRLEATADHVGPGQSETVGYGPVNARRALTAVLPEEGDAGQPVALASQVHTMSAPRHRPQDRLARLLAGTVAGLTALGLVFGASMYAAQRRRERLAAATRAPRRTAIRRRRRRQRIPNA